MTLDTGTYCWFWGVRRNIFTSFYRRNWFCVFMAGSKCYVGIFIRRGISALVQDIIAVFLNFNLTCVQYEYLLQATALLQKNLDNARASLEVLVADLLFLRDQTTITQVWLQTIKGSISFCFLHVPIKCKYMSTIFNFHGTMMFVKSWVPLLPSPNPFMSLKP